MEKILDFEKTKTMEPSKVYRFQCDCLSPEDAMDINIDACGKDLQDKYISITMNFVGTGFFDRLKYAFQILRGRWTWREFVVSPSDHKEIEKIFSSGGYSELK